MFTTLLILLNTIFIGAIFIAAYYVWKYSQKMTSHPLIKQMTRQLMQQATNSYEEDVCCPSGNPYVTTPMIRPHYGEMPEPQIKKSSFDETVAEYEAANDCRVIIINHDIDQQGGMMSYIGGSASKILTMANAVKVMKALQTYDGDNVHMIINTMGGSGDAARVIIEAMSHYNTTVFIPYYAMSAGTMISLHANNIHLGKHAFMGPTDPQINGLPACSILDFQPSESTSFVSDIVRLVQGHVKTVEDEIVALMRARFADAPNCDEIIDVFVKGTRTHGTPFTYKFVSKYLSFVHDGIPENVQNVITAYNNKNTDNMAFCMH